MTDSQVEPTTFQRPVREPPCPINGRVLILQGPSTLAFFSPAVSPPQATLRDRRQRTGRQKQRQKQKSELKRERKVTTWVCFPCHVPVRKGAPLAGSQGAMLPRMTGECVIGGREGCLRRRK